MRHVLSATLAACIAGTAGGLPAPAGAGASSPYIGEIMWVGFTFCPRNWVEANGALIAISSNEALFSLYGTTYGGDGVTTFGVPDLRGRVSIGRGQGPGLPDYRLGQTGGSETTQLNQSTLPVHDHIGVLSATETQARTATPADGSLATAAVNIYTTRGAFDVTLEPGSVTTESTGSGQPFSIVQPLQTIRACICAFGIYPSRS